MKYISEILKQFTLEQRLIVLVILLVFISGTYIATTYFKSPQRSCHDLMELNNKYVRDFVTISDMIRKQKMTQVFEDTVNIGDGDIDYESDSSIMVETDTLQKPIMSIKSDQIFDSILSITESNLSIQK